MRSSTHLFDLIKTMSQTEKRHFKVFSGRQITGDKNQYVQLFDLVDAQVRYDESDILNHISDPQFRKQFAVVKNYLYNQLLKSLSEYHVVRDQQLQVFEMFKQLNVLYNRNLYKQCERLLQRISKRAEILDRDSIWLEIWFWRLELAVRSDDVEAHNAFAKAFPVKIKELVEKIENLSGYQVLGSEVSLVMKQKGDARDKKVKEHLIRIIGHPLLSDEKHCRSPKAVYNFHHINSFINTLLGRQEEAYVHRKKLLNVFRNNDEIILSKPDQYLVLLNNFIASAFRTNRMQDALESLEAMRKLPFTLKKAQFQKIETRWFAYLPNLEMYAAVYDGNFDFAMKVATKVVDELPRFEDKLNKSTLLVFYVNLSYTFYGAGKFESSLLWLNKILNETKDSTRENLHAQARIFDLLLHYDLENFDLLESKIKSTYRYLLKKEQLFGIERVMMRYLKRTVNVVSPDSFRAYCQSFLEELNTTPKTPLEDEMLKRFNLPAWLESKVLQKSFGETIKLRNKRASNNES